jgi:hypothetical protein
LHRRSGQFVKSLAASFTAVSLNDCTILATVFPILDRLLSTVRAIHGDSNYELVNLLLFYLVTFLQTSAQENVFYLFNKPSYFV